MNNSGYNSAKLSVCVIGNMRKIFHYEQNRALTCRELAGIQTFPDEFVFEGKSIQVQQQIGNAVPPKLAFLVAKQVEEALNNAGLSRRFLFFLLSIGCIPSSIRYYTAIRKRQRTKVGAFLCLWKCPQCSSGICIIRQLFYQSVSALFLRYCPGISTVLHNLSRYRPLSMKTVIHLASLLP